MIILTRYILKMVLKKKFTWSCPAINQDTEAQAAASKKAEEEKKRRNKQV